MHRDEQGGEEAAKMRILVVNASEDEIKKCAGRVDGVDGTIEFE